MSYTKSCAVESKAPPESKAPLESSCCAFSCELDRHMTSLNCN